jgi:soluble lytic murein transglycosylase
MRHRAMLLAAVLVIAAPIAAADAGAPERQRFLAAEAAARSEAGPRWRLLAEGLEDYALYPYLEFAALTRDLRSAPRGEVEAFLARDPDSLLATRLRARWLALMAERRDWPAFLAAWRPVDDVALRCAHFAASVATGQADGLDAAAIDLWTQAKPLPKDCDGLEDWLAKRGALDAARVWARIDLAAAAGEVGLVRSLATRLSGDERADAERLASMLADPAGALARAVDWPDRERNRRSIVDGVARLARRDAALAGQRWGALAGRFDFTPAERGEAIGAIAFQLAVRYEPAADGWFAELPAGTGPAPAREWRLRSAIARGRFGDARVAFENLDEAQQRDPRLRWAAARAAELAGDQAFADGLIEGLAGESNLFGFLAADRLERPYVLCSEPMPDVAVRREVDRMPGIVRAFELRALGRDADARREWDHELPRLDRERRAAAVARALEAGWLDRGPLTLLRADETRYYELRFPIGFRREVLAAAERGKLDPAFVLALIRAESAWNVRARSNADARGLMQLLPSTAAAVARREGLPWRGAADLEQPALNIRLGTRYLAERRDRYDGRLWLAAAAYNAGPAPVERWLAARPDLPPDLWSETVPYRETREYITRVMAFSVIYDWRLDGDVARVSTRFGLARPGNSTRTEVTCPAPVAMTSHPSVDRSSS